MSLCSTFFDSVSLEYSSICFTPLTSASMTSVDVTSFSLKKRFTTPCTAQSPCHPAVSGLLLLAFLLPYLLLPMTYITPTQNNWLTRC